MIISKVTVFLQVARYLAHGVLIDAWRCSSGSLAANLNLNAELPSSHGLHHVSSQAQAPSLADDSKSESRPSGDPGPPARAHRHSAYDLRSISQSALQRFKIARAGLKQAGTVTPPNISHKR
jgi:hypothetical protein